ncbi:MAG TPA: hypothetical protein VGB85_13890 [Nannocystis sp.]|jgi:hypothetical protein
MTTSMNLHAAFILLLAPTSSVLSPQAAEYNARAMVFYDAGQLAPAVDEFYAAYRAMPDAHRDRAGREQLLGSMRMTLLALHRETGEAAPLCRLQNILKEHVDALTVAYPNELDRIETRSARARHKEVTAQLAAIGPDACRPPRVAPPVVAPATPPPVAAPTPQVPLADPRTRNQLIAGGVMLPLGVVALAVTGVLAYHHRRHLAEFETTTAGTQPLTDEDCTRLRTLRTATRREEGLMFALGITGGALVATGTALLIRGAMSPRRARLGLDLRRDRVGLTITGEF